MTKNRIDYKGKKIYVGIDVHKKTYSVYCLCEGQLVKKATVSAITTTLVSMLRKYFPEAEIYSAYEAGFSGFVLHRVLLAHGIKNIVVNPASIEVAARDKVKTDKRDCQKIAVQLAAGRLSEIFVPSQEVEQHRLLTRTIEQLVNERTRLGQQFKSRLFQFGYIPFDDKTVMSQKYMEGYLTLELPNELKQALSILCKLWKFVKEEIKSLENLLKVQADSDKNEAVYRSVPGVGPISSRTLSNELGDMSQFRNERTLFSHIGLTPSEFSSGENRRQGHITRQGSARLRWILTEAAWQAIRKDQRLAEDFERISLRAGKKRAIVAIARKLAGRIRACFRKGQLYELGFGLAVQ
jgi:transposase